MDSYNIPVEEVANYFLAKIDPDAGDCISNLKLQKLVYYAQGFVLAITGKKLFNEDILAWQHGPVVRELYNKYSTYGSNCITLIDENITNILRNPNIEQILDEVYQVYGQFSAWKLRNMTHEEEPWQEVSLNEVIKLETMERFFKTLLLV